MPGKPVKSTPLMILGNEIHRTGSIQNVKSEFIVDAFVNVEQRLISLAELNNHKSRAQAKWLAKWMNEINLELSRRDYLLKTEEYYTIKDNNTTHIFGTPEALKKHFDLK